ncbi:chitooligosaccharidolytic beta-N-acetylglucosaminidase isoform X1 [Osmia bicornis bicornis]|uniref:chitooligosaccharidolytic beta-N-acetylglucosaminidase isoform X1 n=2 Tax=Osmia bicornis bicornis TaxID=1437191 RepID=UPI0010FA46C1|nr:chitooligosaccharidolytic beta-N-acetylglucosaminidase isoform X1 [Osmia bicornis bicornis]XP_029052917.1 chitooligosaccharidolytic beta-N-acetylglucosaminidase isoform X1 [Osmia bicornis bicornis]XP_029052918.1 chitooligosaccharidolytic beta-N-acetylglucosaminidase isoform X1 [Osmia bicornis bicornis]XP_029052919.1 chitooligosaccharidolytic beta-N-acetylglucosaminidase isoform X1 [Osmia bicornis bicornis]
MIALLIIVSIVGICSSVDVEDKYRSPWHYKCEGGLCKKELIKKEMKLAVPLEICELFCDASSLLWPKATGHLSLSKKMVHLDPEKIELIDTPSGTQVEHLLERNMDLLRENAKNLNGKLIESGDGGAGMVVRFTGLVKTDRIKLTLHTDESYSLTVTQVNETLLETRVTARSYFGARHALETLSQMIVFNDFRNQIEIPNEISITDGPVYPYRGLLLDTSRNFVDKSKILKTIDGMAMSKLNTLHWHIVDSQSFPYVSRRWPKFSTFGRYARNKIYDQKDINEIRDYGLVRGVRVLPEFDAPAHVGEGWQWVGNDAIVCFKAEPWKSYCVEPPCGQLNPTSDFVYEILEGIYRDMFEDFQPDLFHMGGDEVNLNCWNSSVVIQNWMKTVKGWNLSETSFYMVWEYFQEQALERVRLANGGKEIPVILWTSGLTNEKNINRLDPDKYIIQIWTTAKDPTVARLLRNNFRVIFSNYDALYLDCGFSAWIGDGNNWCSPYKGWQKVYENSPFKIIRSQGLEMKRNLVLGGEATLWTEQADSVSVDSKLWPRSAALAERLWAEPNSSWIYAEHRMLRHRQRLVKRGILADALEPEWCLQNQGHCYA